MTRYGNAHLDEGKGCAAHWGGLANQYPNRGQPQDYSKQNEQAKRQRGALDDRMVAVEIEEDTDPECHYQGSDSQ